MKKQPQQSFDKLKGCYIIHCLSTFVIASYTPAGIEGITDITTINTNWATFCDPEIRNFALLNINNMQNLKEMIAVITGASSGIGKAIAVELAKNGVKVVLGARRIEELEELTQEIKKNGGEAIFLKTDVSCRADLVHLVNFAVEKYGRLDVMINNAGIARLSRIDALDIDGWDEMIDVNIKGVLYGIAAAIPVFKQHGSGHIVNIISTSGIKIVPAQGVYAGTKNAVRTIAEAFRQESDGSIRITGISPGYIKTDFAAKSVNTEEMKTAATAAVERMAISPEAVARAVIYAISQPKDVEIGDIVIRPAKQD